MKRKKLQHLFYEVRKQLLLPVLKFVNWLISKLHHYTNSASKHIAENKTVREGVQSATKVLKKYDHKKGRIVWRSRQWGTYVRAIHGTLK